jgi:hypothetical protein
MTRSECLDMAKAIVTQDRCKTYGTPEDSFGRIAALWNAYLGDGRAIAPSDVAAMMALLKIARIAENPAHMDSFVDLAGYAACGAEVATG